MPKYLYQRGADGGKRCAYCGRRAHGLLLGPFGLCKKCRRDGVEETLRPCPRCKRKGTLYAMDEDEIKIGICRKCQTSP